MISEKLYLFAKKIHRFLVLLISTIGILMAGTGILLKYKPDFINLGSVRLVHNSLSPYFALVFLGMMITGLIMYIFPLIQKRQD